MSRAPKSVMLSNRVRGVVGGLAVPLLVGSLLAGCGSSGAAAPATTRASDPPASSTSSATATKTVTTTVTTTPTMSPTKSTVTATGIAHTSTASQTSRVDCKSSQLSLRTAEAEGGDSHGGLIIVFTNMSHARCSLFGYPGAAALDSSGAQFEQARRTFAGYIAGCSCTSLHTVRLAPGGSASSVVEGDNGGGNECLRGRYLLVTAPNTTQSRKVRYVGAYSCRLQVHPVIAGTTGGNRH